MQAKEYKCSSSSDDLEHFKDAQHVQFYSLLLEYIGLSYMFRHNQGNQQRHKESQINQSRKLIKRLHSSLYMCQLINPVAPERMHKYMAICFITVFISSRRMFTLYQPTEEGCTSKYILCLPQLHRCIYSNPIQLNSATLSFNGSSPPQL